MFFRKFRNETTTQLETVNLRLDEIACRLSQIEEKLEGFTGSETTYRDMNDITQDNLNRLNKMTLELKGVVAMTRASFKTNTTATTEPKKRGRKKKMTPEEMWGKMLET